MSKTKWYDDICKELAGEHPEAFVKWILKKDVKREEIEILNTELSADTIYADFLIKVRGRLLHIEFQLTADSSNPPIPRRMLGYWLRLYAEYNLPITQVVILLKETAAGRRTKSYFETETTRHEFTTIKMWEQDPKEFLKVDWLIPFAVLGKTENRKQLFLEVRDVIEAIQDPEAKLNVLTCTGIVAGIYSKKEIVFNIFQEDTMSSSSVYQSILKKGIKEGKEDGIKEGKEDGIKEGKENGIKEGELTIVRRLLARKLGIVPVTEMLLLEQLPSPQLEELSDAIFDFSSPTDLQHWLSAQQVH